MSFNQQVPSPEPSDEDLVERVQRQDVAAFSLLFDRYHQTIFAFASYLLGHNKANHDAYHDAEEIVQEVFLRLWDRAGQFDPVRGSFRSWFMAIARNLIMDELKRNNRQQRLKDVDGIEAVLLAATDGDSNVEAAVWKRARGQAVLEALRDLPLEQRKTLLLAYFGGLSQSDIAQELDLPLGTVKKRVRLGLQKLRRKLFGWDETS